jgi:hypothetical protein
MSDDELLAALTGVAVLVADAVRTGDAALLVVAGDRAATSRDRQLVALAAAHLAGDHDRFDALVRDHLAEHPDHVVAAWLAAVHRHQLADRHIHPDRRNPC